MWVINYIEKLYSLSRSLLLLFYNFFPESNFNQFFNRFKKLFWSEYNFLHLKGL